MRPRTRTKLPGEGDASHLSHHLLPAEFTRVLSMTQGPGLTGMVLLELHDYTEVRHDITRHHNDHADLAGAARPELRRGADRCSVVPGALQRQDTRGVSGRSARVLPVGSRSRHRGDEGDASAHRTVPSVDGATRSGRSHRRPSTLDGVRLLPIRAHRRDHHVQPGQVRPTTTSPSDRGERSGSE